MSTPPLTAEINNRVGVITLNRPDKLNALNNELLQLGINQLQTLARDPNIGAIIVTGAGKAFCAGGDLAVIETVA